MRGEDRRVPQTITRVPTGLGDLTGLVEGAEGFAPLVEALRRGDSATIDGAWGSSAALAAAALAGPVGGTLLVVIAHPRDVDGWAGDLASFAGLQPAVFPAWDDRPGAAGGPFDEVAGQRLRLLRQLEGPN